ncbi:MAG: type II toxin-antitoxin system HicA family toxin [Parcubacteria group bacterium]|nr:type II toxin-antitoxin system HicA family toxin [Parcubacteria group bacterium]
MPKLPSLSAKKVISILKTCGFQLHHTTGSHFVFRHPETKRRVTVPFHIKDLPKGTLFSILKQAGISKNEL